MADNNSIVQLAVDAYHGEVGKYSNKDSMEVLRKSLVEANGAQPSLITRELETVSAVSSSQL